MSRNNPENILIQSRGEREVNQKVVLAELKAMYTRKAQRVGMSLQAYCERFNVRGIV